MLLGSVFTLGLVPRALRDVGKERQRVGREMPGASFEKVLAAGYRLNVLLLLVEITYYYLLVSFAAGRWQLFYGGLVFGVIHIFYLVVGRFEKRRLSRRQGRTGLAKAFVRIAGLLTLVEAVFLLLAGYLLLNPPPG